MAFLDFLSSNGFLSAVDFLIFLLSSFSAYKIHNHIMPKLNSTVQIVAPPNEVIPVQ